MIIIIVIIYNYNNNKIHNRLFFNSHCPCNRGEDYDSEYKETFNCRYNYFIGPAGSIYFQVF